MLAANSCFITGREKGKRGKEEGNIHKPMSQVIPKPL